MSEYIGPKSLFDQMLELKAENERVRRLVAELVSACHAARHALVRLRGRVL